MNILDVIAVCIILVSVLTCWKRGLILSIFHLFSFIVSLGLTYALYPVVGRMLRNTPLFGYFKGAVADKIGGSPLLPDFLGASLAANDNPEIYKLLKIGEASDYFSSYLAALVINAISMILVFFIVSLIMKIIMNVLSIVSKLPVIHTFDKMGGLVVGVVQGVFVVWILFAISPVFIALTGIGPEFSEAVQGSMAAGLYFGKYNLMLQSLLKSIIR